MKWGRWKDSKYLQLQRIKCKSSDRKYRRISSDTGEQHTGHCFNSFLLRRKMSRLTLTFALSNIFITATPSY